MKGWFGFSLKRKEDGLLDNQVFRTATEAREYRAEPSSYMKPEEWFVQKVIVMPFYDL